MPTTEPLDPGDDAEGQLRPIAHFGETAVQPPRTLRPGDRVSGDVQPPQAPSTAQAATSTAQTVGQPQAPTAAPAAPVAAPAIHAPGSPRLRTTLGAPKLSLSGKTDRQQPKAAAQVAEKAHGDFTDQQFAESWARFISTHERSHMLANTMRAAMPERQSDGNFLMKVASEIQVEIMAGAMTELLDHLHGELGNEVFSLVVMADAANRTPLAWDDREALADMASRFPAFKDFVETLDLKID